MRLNEVNYDGATPITGYGPGFFRVGDAVIEGAALIAPGQTLSWAGLSDTGALLRAAQGCDVVLLGMGGEIAHPPEAVQAALDQAGIGVELMSSPSACRTYNVLLGEGRRIIAALLPVAPA